MKPSAVLLGACLAALSPALSSAEPRQTPIEYRFYADPQMGPEAGIINVTTGARLWLRSVDAGLQSLEPSVASSPAAVLQRFAGFALLGLPAASYELVLGHEIYGHGARISEFGGTPRYHLDLPLPYTLEPEYQTAISSLDRPLSDDEWDLIWLAGLEAQEVQQLHLAFTAFRSGRLHHGDAILYAGNSLTHMAQVITGSDVRQHRGFLQRRFGADLADEELRADLMLAWDAIDPLLWYSLYASAYRYLLRGDPEIPYPAVSLGDWELSATSRTRVVPWGIEHQVDLLAATPVLNADGALRIGGGPGGTSVALSLDVMDIRPLSVLHLGASLSLWTQPGLQVEGQGHPLPSAWAAGQGDPPPSDWPAGGIVAPPARYDVPEQLYGIGGTVLMEFHQPTYFFGTRVGGKSAGLLVGQPVGAHGEALLTGGVKL